MVSARAARWLTRPAPARPKLTLRPASLQAEDSSSALSAPAGSEPPMEEFAAPQTTQDLTVFVQDLLQQMQGRFATMSDAIIGRIDEMGHRIDELENSIGELMAQAGIEEEPAAEGAEGAEAAEAAAANSQAPTAA